jgi:micrococcal nuclease
VTGAANAFSLFSFLFVLFPNSRMTDNKMGLSRPRRALAWAAACAFGLQLGLHFGAAQAARPQGQAHAGTELSGTVTKVSDGDTFWLRPAHCGDTPTSGCRPVKIRMLGIDAPESCQPGGERAAQALRSRLLNQTVQVTSSSHDVYGRALGAVRLQGDDVGAWMVSQGHAWSYRHRRSQGPYVREETQARQAQRGLFADASPTEPRVFRKQHGPCQGA